MSVEPSFSFLQVTVSSCDINMRTIHSFSRKLFVLFAVLSSKKLAGCNPITNTDLNDRIREFSSKNDDINSTDIKTLQKESGRYGNFSPVRSPVRFKDVSDSTLSSSSYSRGLAHHEHPGYSLQEYEESPPVYAYEYPVHAPGPDHGFVHHHGYDHHAHHHGHHVGHHDINYHHKHYDHALAAKAFLWPVAGIALLGAAAAALVSNPVLLQLGVVSGRRKRRDTEESYDTEQHETKSELSWLKKENEEQVLEITENKTSNENLNKFRLTFKDKSHDNEPKHKLPVTKYSARQDALFQKLQVHPTVQSPVETTTNTPKQFYRSTVTNRSRLVPVRLIFKEKTTD